MAKKKSSIFNLDIQFSDNDLNQLFESFDPMNVRSKDYLPQETHEEPWFDPMDAKYMYGMRDEVMLPIIYNYFRAELINEQYLPEHGPAILGCNHSGTAFPHDAMVLDGLIWKRDGTKLEKKCRSVFSPKLAKAWWMRVYGIDNFWRRCGAVDMTFGNFDELLRRGERVIYYPEGVPGIGKGFNRRYELQHFYSSFVVLAAKHRAPFVPICAINAEWVNPTSITIKWIDRIFDALLGIPFIPIPAMFIGMVFPFFFYLSFPCEMKFVVCKPIDVNALLKEEGCTHIEHATKEVLNKVASRVQQSMQADLTQYEKEYGKKPYNLPTLVTAMKELGRKKWLYTPLGWPWLFIRNARNHERPPAKNAFTNWLRDIDILAYYIPFGWIILSLCRALRKYPYGYRNLSKEEARNVQGSYFWQMKRRPDY